MSFRTFLRRQFRIERRFAVQFVSIVVAAHGAFILVTSLIVQLGIRHATHISDVDIDLPLLVGLSLLYLSTLLRRRKRRPLRGQPAYRPGHRSHPHARPRAAATFPAIGTERPGELIAAVFRSRISSGHRPRTRPCGERMAAMTRPGAALKRLSTKSAKLALSAHPERPTLQCRPSHLRRGR